MVALILLGIVALTFVLSIPNLLIAAIGLLPG